MKREENGKTGRLSLNEVKEPENEKSVFDLRFSLPAALCLAQAEISDWRSVLQSLIADRRLQISSCFPILLLVMVSGCGGYEMRELLYFSRIDKDYQKQVRSLAEQDGFDRRRASVSLLGHEKCCGVAFEKSRPFTIYRHAAYVHHACPKCHVDLSEDSAAPGAKTAKLALPKAQLCLQCHQKTKENKFLHGPIGVGECLSCHTPHISRLDSLLRYPDRKMCLNCHKKKDVAKGKYHSSIGGRGCLECHYPHGGNDKSFLKPEPVQAR